MCFCVCVRVFISVPLYNELGCQSLGPGPAHCCPIPGVLSSLSVTFSIASSHPLPVAALGNM